MDGNSIPEDEPMPRLCNSQPQKLLQDDSGEHHHIQPRKFETHFSPNIEFQKQEQKPYSYL